MGLPNSYRLSTIKPEEENRVSCSNNVVEERMEDRGGFLVTLTA